VEPETALAPLDFVDAEVTAFPKGHVAIATSWSFPQSAYALHSRYEKENTRGPVRFQLDLQEALDSATPSPAPPKKRNAGVKGAKVDAVRTPRRRSKSSRKANPKGEPA